MSPSPRITRVLLTLSILVVIVPLVAASDTPTGRWKYHAFTPFRYWRFDAEYVAERNEIFVLGGRRDDNSTEGKILRYNVGNPGPGFDTGQTMPIPISNYDIALLSDENGLGLYVFAGRPAEGGVIPDTQVYYPATNTAMIVASDPFPGRAENGDPAWPGGVAVVANKAYAVGGLAADPVSVTDVGKQTWIYDPMAPPQSRWTRGPDLSLARGYIAVTAHDDRYVYAIGGDDYDIPNATLFPVHVVERLDTRNINQGWQRMADLPQPCDEMRAYAVGAKIYTAGCGQWPDEIPDSYQYDTATNTWSSYPPLNMDRRNYAGATFPVPAGHTVLFLVGGRQDTDTNILNSSEVSIAD